MTYTLEQLTEFAKDVELGDSISWDGLNVDRDRIYQIMASQIYDQSLTWGDDDKEIVMLASIVKLLVENFVFNVKVESLEMGR